MKMKMEIYSQAKEENNMESISNRRSFVSNTCALIGTIVLPYSTPAIAAETTTTTTMTTEEDNNANEEEPVIIINKNPIEMKYFVDPQGLFALRIPKSFYAIRRSAKGDLPNSKTGKGRRGSSIFTAGDLSKAEIIAVERFPTAALLEDEGIQATGDLSTFPSIGNSIAIAKLLNLRRERENKPSSVQAGGSAIASILDDTVQLSEDGKTLTFSMKSQIDVQKPELLMEQMGVNELYRITTAKATLTGNDGQLMAIFASALSQDYNGADGLALEETVDSFVALDQSSAVAK